MTVIPESIVAGQPYPGNASEPSATIQEFFDEAKGGPVPTPKTLVAPHAGSIYSGRWLPRLTARDKQPVVGYGSCVFMG